MRVARNLAGQIETYLKELLEASDFIELRRSQLAEIFRCVPSQINYVLSTRFTPTQGYIVESRRGGGGYLKIVKLSWSGMSADHMDAFAIMEEKGISQTEAEGLLRRLREDEIITGREHFLLRAMLDRQALGESRQDQDRLRMRLLLAAVNTLFRMDV